MLSTRPSFLHRGEEWGEFLHLPGQKFYDFNEIRDEIVRETDRLTGRNKGISNKSINLKIFSPHVLNLTLVDLPGITKVPTGDQPADVEEQIRNMCLEFISNPNAIILAVTAANQDLANSDGLQLARSVDPDGDRTIGVLTKVDIMDHGTDCSDILENQVIPLRRGYIAVINRSQRDVVENLTIRKGLAKEDTYFRSHPKYSRMMAKCGTKNLARVLNTMLMHHIRDCLPEIKSRITKMLMNVQNNLEALGESLDDRSDREKGFVLLKILSQFATNFAEKVDGKSSNELQAEMTELYGGARIAYIFNEVFGKRLKSLDPFDGLEDDDIRTAIANANGTRPALFVPEIAFDLLVRRQIARLEQPGLQCLDMVVEEMQRMIMQSESIDVSRFPELRDRMMEVTMAFLKSCLTPASKMISNLIQIELAYINTSHPDFIGGKAAAVATQQARAKAVAAASANETSTATAAATAAAAAPSLPDTPGSTRNGGGNFHGVFRAGQQPPAPAVPHTPPPVPQRRDYDNVGGVRLPAVPDKVRSNNQPTDRER